MTFRRTFLAAAAVALVLSLFAATVSPAAVSTAPAWEGPYAGLFAGHGWGRARATSAFDANTGFFYNWTGNAYSSDAGGFFGGGTLGANWQSGPFVFGIEGEIGYLGLKGSQVDPNFQPGTVPLGDTVTEFKSDLYAAAYGRLGIARGAMLLYGKAGMAFLRAEASTIDPCANAPGCGTGLLTLRGSKTMPGWSAGGGIEWRFRPHWSAKAEYAYYDFGSIDTAGPSNVPGEHYRQSLAVTAHTVKAGLNYRF
jgi:outer membrane immunogenic protein